MVAKTAPARMFQLWSVAPQAARKIAKILGKHRAEFFPAANELRFAAALMRDVPWDAYQLLVDSVEHGRFRHTYDNGTLEMMSPSYDHENTHKLISRMLEMLSFQWQTAILSVGSTTQRKKGMKKGVEPDASYYFQSELTARELLAKGERAPPPDLAIEVDIRSSSIPRLPTYAKLGIREVWRFDGKTMTFLKLGRSSKYIRVKSSLAFPILAPNDLLIFLQQRAVKSENEIVREFLEYISQKVAALTRAKRNHQKKD
jgi:Uma2 family endonuclease